MTFSGHDDSTINIVLGLLLLLLVFSRLASTDVHFWSVCRSSSVTHAQAVILIASVGQWHLLGDQPNLV